MSHVVSFPGGPAFFYREKQKCSINRGKDLKGDNQKRKAVCHRGFALGTETGP